MLKWFRYKVFRQKLLLSAAGTLFVAMLITAAAYAVLRTGWVTLAQSRASQLAQAVEWNLQNEDELLTMQIASAYASPQLIDDILRMFESRTFGEYLEARLRRSQETDAPIRSFPEYLRAHIRSHGSALYQVAFHGSGFTHVLRFGSGEIQYEFDAAYTPPGIQDGVTVRKTVYNPLNNQQTIGDLSFAFRTGDIVSGIDFSGFTLAALRDGRGNVRLLSGTDPTGGAALRDLTPVQESGAFAYQTFAYMDDVTLIRDNLPAVTALMLVMVALSAAFILFSMYSSRYDALFVERIFATIDAMKRGVFDSADDDGTARYQRNEYGRIARELNDMSLKLKRYIEAEYQFKIQQQQAEMRMLQSQINPHSLYNTLEIISAQAQMEHDKPASDAVAALGSMFREMTTLPSQIPMRDEVHLLKAYLRIMEYRFADIFSYHAELDPALEDFPTVKFWMQPLAENFFSHGLDRNNPYNLLIVRVYRDNGTVCVDLSNNGLPIPEERLQALNENLSLPEEPHAGIGLRNVYDRLQLFYGGGVTLRIANGEESGVTLRIRIQRGANDV
jgi:hypothetical protein